MDRTLMSKRAKIESVVIVKQASGGYTAHLRFDNPKMDEYISTESKWAVYSRIEGILWRKGIKF